MRASTLVELGMALCTAAMVSNEAHAQDVLPREDKAAIERVLQQSAVDWSHGDLGAFMRSYEDAPGTAFVTGGGLLQGYVAIRSHYAARYGSGSKMGALRFDVLEERALAPAYALVTGRFMLARPAADGGAASGIFTLLFHHGTAGWRIAYDHTS